jgi:hypothetical protein
MTRRKKLILLSPLFVAGLLGFVALGGAIVQQLWNWLLPPLFGWHEVTFWQALGVLALCRILFGRWGGGGGGSRWSMKRRADRMSPEDRQKLLEHLRARWGCRPETGA